MEGIKTKTNEVFQLMKISKVEKNIGGEEITVTLFALLCFLKPSVLST